MTNIAVGIGIASRYSIHTSRLANTPVAGSVCNQFAAAALREQEAQGEALAMWAPL